MTFIRTQVLTAGPGPSEQIVSITTSSGEEEQVVLHSSVLDNHGRIEVGFLGSKDDEALVELPRESASGKWRVWVQKSSLEAA